MIFQDADHPESMMTASCLRFADCVKFPGFGDESSIPQWRAAKTDLLVAAAEFTVFR
jgi:hypothetical protein